MSRKRANFLGSSGGMCTEKEFMLFTQQPWVQIVAIRIFFDKFTVSFKTAYFVMAFEIIARALYLWPQGKPELMKLLLFGNNTLQRSITA